MLDGFDFTILTFLLVDIQRSFTVDKALAGALGTITLIFRVAGGIGAGTAADRWGRKGPLMFSILWYSVFSFLGGFSTSYGMLFAIRALFGIGMGGVWAAGMPLTLEHWPAHLRGTASGLMQSGYSMGFLLSSLVFEFVYPLVNHGTDMGWRWMMWIGILPSFLVFFIMKGVKESPVWLDRQAHLKKHSQTDSLSLLRLFKPDLIWTTVHTSLLMGAFLFMYHSITYWYPTLITQMHRPTLPYLAALNIGGITGGIAFGRISEGALGRRGSATIATLIGILVDPDLRLHAEHAAAAGRRADDGVLRRREFRRRARLPDRALPDGRARGRRRLRVPRRRRIRIVHADAGRAAAGPRAAAADGDGRLHRRLGDAGDHPDVARPGNTRPPFHRGELISRSQYLKERSMNGRIRVAALLTSLVCAPIAARQAQPPQFGAANRTVAVYATVTGARGRLVPDLTRDDFAIDDNGKRQALTLFANDIQPITLIMLLDRSGSMKPNFELEERAAEAFVHAMLPADKARIGSFAKIHPDRSRGLHLGPRQADQDPADRAAGGRADAAVERGGPRHRQAADRAGPPRHARLHRRRRHADELRRPQQVAEGRDEARRGRRRDGLRDRARGPERHAGPRRARRPIAAAAG